jgi:hypothetical protein
MIEFVQNNSGVKRTPLLFLQSIFGNHTTDFSDIGAGDKIKSHSAHAGKPQIQFAVHIKHTCGLHGVCLNLAVWQGGEVFFLAREDAVGTPYSVPPLALTKKSSSFILCLNIKGGIHRADSG